MRRRLALLCLAALTAPAGAQEVGLDMPPIVPPFRQLEHYGYLADPERRSGAWWEPFKRIPLWPGERVPFATLGGEVRVRYELIDNSNFGAGPQDEDGGYLLTRFLPYLGIHVPGPAGSELQLFGQAIIAWNDYDQRGAGPVDEEEFDALQLFGKISVPLGEGKLAVQAGRQLVSFGSERLVTARFGPNVPLSFDGGLARYDHGPWTLHGFYLRPVQVAPDPLDSLSGDDQQFWGVYSTRQLGDVLPGSRGAGVDFYYLGYFNAEATYASGTGRELRHTLGSRLFGAHPLGPGAVDWNYEGFLQFGSFDSQRGQGSILAWSLGTETGYTFELPADPRLALRANVVSGDLDPNDVNLQTFNPLFPKGKYFGELTPIGPYNLINLQGFVELRPTRDLLLVASGGPYWRYSDEDAVYGVGGNIVRQDNGSNARFIGAQVEFLAEWRPLRELGFLASYSQFLPGDFLEQTGPANTIHFFALEAVFRF